jgi:polysaccharide biosynthesis protein PslG
MVDKRLFGVSTHLPKISTELIHQEIDLLISAGVSSVRIGFLWSDIEPEAGKYVWGKLDLIVKLFNEADIEILGTLARTPPWANGGKECGLFCFHTPVDLNQYNSFVAQTVLRFKDKVKYWEIWNEPNSNNFWYPKADIAKYAEMLKKAYTAAKEVNPECIVMNGGIMCCREYRVNFEYMEQFFRHDCSEFTDVINIHPYSGPNPPECDFHETIDRLTIMMHAYGCPDKKIWLTELGTPQHRRFAPSEEEQASHVLRHYLCTIERPEIERVFWYDFRNDGNDVECFEHNFGLVNNDYSLKKAFRTYSAMTHKLAGCRFASVMERDKGGWLYLFDAGEYMTAIVWSKERQTILLKKINYELWAKDQAGEVIELVFKGDTVDLTLNPAPSYIDFAKSFSEQFIRSFIESNTLIGI